MEPAALSDRGRIGLTAKLCLAALMIPLAAACSSTAAGSASAAQSSPPAKSSPAGGQGFLSSARFSLGHISVALPIGWENYDMQGAPGALVLIPRTASPCPESGVSGPLICQDSITIVRLPGTNPVQLIVKESDLRFKALTQQIRSNPVVADRDVSTGGCTGHLKEWRTTWTNQPATLEEFLGLRTTPGKADPSLVYVFTRLTATPQAQAQVDAIVSSLECQP